MYQRRDEKGYTEEVFTPEFTDAVVVNVWDWDPDWTVEWYEDGVSKGAMKQVRAPSASEVHSDRSGAGPSMWPRCCRLIKTSVVLNDAHRFLPHL